MQAKIKHLVTLVSIVSMIVACASIGSPDGGPFDETPPVFLGSTPDPFALGVKDKRVTLKFDEFITLWMPSDYSGIQVLPTYTKQFRADKSPRPQSNWPEAHRFSFQSA